MDDLLKGVPLTQSPASDTVPVSVVPAAQFSMATPVIDLVQSMPAPVVSSNVSEGSTTVPMLPMFLQSQAFLSSEVQGFNFPIGDSAVNPGQDELFQFL